MKLENYCTRGGQGPSLLETCSLAEYPYYPVGLLWQTLLFTPSLYAFWPKFDFSGGSNALN